MHPARATRLSAGDHQDLLAQEGFTEVPILH